MALQKGVSLGMAGSIYGPNPFTFANNQGFFNDTTGGAIPTRFVRIWASWPVLQPFSNYAMGVTPPGYVPPSPRITPSDALQRLDDSIAAANANAAGKINVILVLKGTPEWASTQNYDRFKYVPTDPSRNVNYQGTKSREQLFPDSVDANSPWANMVKFLLQRYANAVDASHRILALEIINEPNFEYWPAVSPTAPCTVAQMMITATAVGTAVNKQCFFTGPGLADSLTDGTKSYSYRDMTTGVANLLQQSNWHDTSWVWSHHNYNDVRHDMGSSTMAPDRADTSKNRYVMRASYVPGDLQSYSWGGYRDPASGLPAVWITEGGCNREHLAGTWGSAAVPGLWAASPSADLQQSVLLQRNHNRLVGPEGLAIGLMMNYLFTTSTDYDSGLCDAAGTKRTLPFQTWGGFA